MKVLYKKLGQTPLECIENYRLEGRIEKEIPMTYAGRLDPMAEGLLICLVGEECKEKEKYTGLSKRYEFEVLVGFSTDTYDLLGLVQKSQSRGTKEALFADTLKNFAGLQIQKYPSFSSKTVGGKQLFQLSKDGELPDQIPEHKILINKLELVSTRKISLLDLQKEIVERVRKVKGDFRQEEIIDTWHKVFDLSKEKEFEILSLVCDCSTGTYIRQLVSDIGESLQIPCVTFSIKRTRVGDYSLADLDLKES